MVLPGLSNASEIRASGNEYLEASSNHVLAPAAAAGFALIEPKVPPVAVGTPPLA